MNDQYAVYLRKSRKDLELEALGQGETLARHRRALIDLAASQHLAIGRIYEEMVSGESIADRPVMRELLADVEAGLWRGVLVMEVERLARGNTRDQGEVAEIFAASKTLIVTPLKTYDPTNEYDEEYFEFGLFMSRREYKTIRRRMQRGLMASIQEGNYTGSLPPYGYDIVRISKKERTLVPNDAAPVVVQMFKWFTADSLSPGEIARRLTDMGIPTQTGRPEWNRGTVKDILKNDLYRGMVRWNRRRVTKEKVEGVQKRVKHRQLSEDYMIVPGKHPALIDEDTFRRAQERFKANDCPPVNTSGVLINPLAGLLVCAKCGKAMRYQAYPSRPGTMPRYAHPESTVCTGVKSARADEVMDALTEALSGLCDDFTLQVDNYASDKEKRPSEHLVASVRKDIETLERRRVQLFEYLETGLYTPAEFSERREALTRQLEALRATLQSAESEKPEDIQARIVKYTEVLASLRDANVGARAKNSFLRETISRIDYSADDLGRGNGTTVHLDLYLKD